jgi:N-methylhydantoinase A
MRFACDTGGTFTDLIVEADDGGLHMFKAPTTPDDPIRGVLIALDAAAHALGMSQQSLLKKGSMFIHGTTRAINAIITENTAKTALLTTKGNPDVLFFREGGRIEPFNFNVPYPKPYIPRHLTYEIPERIGADGNVVETLDEVAVREIAAQLRKEKVEAIAVSLLWSIVNPDHEIRVLEILAEELPNIPVTAGHQINPIIREYRRTSSAAIDASLKPLMGAYMRNLEKRLRDAGFDGRVLVVTSQGGVMDASEVAKTPIHCINSGPAMAPVAGRYYADVDADVETAVVADTGGTTYDVSLIHGGDIPWTNETWIGQPFRGHMTGFPSVDVKSVGAGGGSIAWVDAGGMLRIGPQSAGADPGPVCYGRGGTLATVTDAAITLGYIDATNFLGGAMVLDLLSAQAAIFEQVAKPLSLSLEEAAAAIIDVATENMVHAIEDITVNQGTDPSKAILIGGGGAAGLNSVLIGKRLRCHKVVIPETGAALSAAGALMSDLTSQFRTMAHMNTDTIHVDDANRILAELMERCQIFAENAGEGIVGHTIEFGIEGHYPSQVWDISAPLAKGQFDGPEDITELVNSFHKNHEKLFAFADRDSGVEIVSWQAMVRCRFEDRVTGRVQTKVDAKDIGGTRRCYFPAEGFVNSDVYAFGTLAEGQKMLGPAIIESDLTTVVLNPGAVAEKTASGSLVIDLSGMR